MNYPKRKTTRLKNYDYSTNHYYFITICTYDKKCIFGNPWQLSLFGKIAEEEILELSGRYDGVMVDCYKVMPNHIHAVLVLDHANKSITEIIGNYKAGVTRRIHVEDPKMNVWQRSFYDHIIRNEKSYLKIWEYVTYNDQKWSEDCYYINEEV